MSLRSYYNGVYVPLRLVGASPRTTEAYETALAIWGRHNSNVSLAEISEITLARFQAQILPGRSPASVNCYLRHLAAILAHYHATAGTAAPRWRKLREPRRVPLALTVDEFSAVIQEAKTERGSIGGVPAKLWWRSLLLAAWDTGCRMTAMLGTRSADFLPGKGLLVSAEVQKDNEGQWFFLPPDTLAVVAELAEYHQKMLWPRHLTVETIGKRFRRILDRSGIYAPKGSGMRFHRLRRSKASYTEAAGGDAQKALGHSTRAVTERYLDPRICADTRLVFMPRPA